MATGPSASPRVAKRLNEADDRDQTTVQAKSDKNRRMCYARMLASERNMGSVPNAGLVDIPSRDAKCRANITEEAAGFGFVTCGPVRPLRLARFLASRF